MSAGVCEHGPSVAGMAPGFGSGTFAQLPQVVLRLVAAAPLVLPYLLARVTVDDGCRGA